MLIYSYGLPMLLLSVTRDGMADTNVKQYEKQSVIIHIILL